MLKFYIDLHRFLSVLSHVPFITISHVRYNFSFHLFRKFCFFFSFLFFSCHSVAGFPLDFCWLVGVDSHKHIRSFFFFISFLSCLTLNFAHALCVRVARRSKHQIEIGGDELYIRVYGESYTERCGSTTTRFTITYKQLESSKTKQRQSCRESEPRRGVPLPVGRGLTY